MNVLVTGASGLLGAKLVDQLLAAEHAVTGTFHAHPERAPARERFQPVALDLADERSIEAAFRAAWPDAVLHAAALSELKACETDPDLATRVNVRATEKLARLAAALGARFVFFSTDQVFDGSRGGWKEGDDPHPLHHYGKTKADAEEAAWRHHPSATVLRLALLLGRSPSGDRSATEKLAADLKSGRPVRLFTDEIRTPLLVDDAARVAIDLLEARDLPLLHLGGPERVSRHDLGLRVARVLGLPADRIESASLETADLVPKRPRDLSLDTCKLVAAVRRPPRGIDAALEALMVRA